MDHEVVCPNCQETFPVRRKYFGNTVECPHCAGDVYLDANDLPQDVAEEEKVAAKVAGKQGLKRRPSEHGRRRRKRSPQDDVTGTRPPGEHLRDVPRKGGTSLALIGLACFGAIIVIACAAGGLFMAFNVQDKSLREYAGDRIYGEDYKIRDDRLIASILAYQHHDEARQKAGGDGGSSLFIDKEKYYEVLKELVNQDLAEMNNKIDVSMANMAGTWSRAAGNVDAVLTLRGDGSFEYRMNDREKVEQTKGQWKTKNGQLGRRAAGNAAYVEIVKLSAAHLVLRNRDGSLEIYRKKDAAPVKPQDGGGQQTAGAPPPVEKD